MREFIEYHDNYCIIKTYNNKVLVANRYVTKDECNGEFKKIKRDDEYGLRPYGY